MNPLIMEYINPFLQTLELSEEEKLQADKDRLNKQQVDPFGQSLANRLTEQEKRNPSDLTRILTRDYNG